MSLEFAPLDDKQIATLRLHQEAAYVAVLGVWTDPVADGLRAAAVVHPTGSGKTVLAGKLLAEHLTDSTHRILVVVPTKEIAQQFEARIRTEADELGIERTFGRAYDGNAQWDADVVFATYDAVRNITQRDGDQVPCFDTLVYDEAHHLPAKENSTAFNVVSTIEGGKAKYMLALTATPMRTDDGPDEIPKLYAMLALDDATHEYPIEDAIADGVIAAVDYRIYTDVLSEQWRHDVLPMVTAGDTSALQEREQADYDRTEIAKRIRQNTYPDPGNNSHRPTIVFTGSVEEAQRFAEQLGNKFRAVWGESKTRDADIEAFRDGRVHGLVTFNVLNEGIDLPTVEVVASLRNTQSPIVYLQQIGRGLRRLAGVKERVTILDFTHSIERIALAKALIDRINRRATNRTQRGEPTDSEPTTLTLNDEALNGERAIEFDEVLQLVRGAFASTRLTPDELVAAIEKVALEVFYPDASTRPEHLTAHNINRITQGFFSDAKTRTVNATFATTASTLYPNTNLANSTDPYKLIGYTFGSIDALREQLATRAGATLTPTIQLTGDELVAAIEKIACEFFYLDASTRPEHLTADDINRITQGFF